VQIISRPVLTAVKPPIIFVERNKDKTQDFEISGIFNNTMHQAIKLLVEIRNDKDAIVANVQPAWVLDSG
jgi:hypothetical protein